MTKVEFIKQVHSQHKNITQKSVSNFLNTIFDAIKQDIYQKRKFTYPGFGTFIIKQRKERIGRNPQNGKKITIKASKTVSFKPAKLFKEEINK